MSQSVCSAELQNIHITRTRRTLHPSPSFRCVLTYVRLTAVATVSLSFSLCLSLAALFLYSSCIKCLNEKKERKTSAVVSTHTPKFKPNFYSYNVFGCTERYATRSSSFGLSSHCTYRRFDGNEFSVSNIWIVLGRSDLIGSYKSAAIVERLPHLPDSHCRRRRVYMYICSERLLFAIDRSISDIGSHIVAPSLQCVRMRIQLVYLIPSDVETRDTAMNSASIHAQNYNR